MGGWIWNSDPDARHLVTSEVRQAANAVGIDLNMKSFKLNLAPAMDFIAQRSIWYQNKANRSPAYNVMQVGQGSTGGFTVGQTLLNVLEQATLDYSGVMQVADLIRTPTGEQLIWPMVDDTSNTGRRIGEGNSATEATAAAWKRLTLHSHTFTSDALKISRQLLRDSIFNLVGLIGNMLGTRIGRKFNTDFTLGSGGGNAPLGIVVGSALGVTSASATAIAFDEIIDLEHSVDPSRRNGATYMFHDGVLQALRKLKDGDGNYLWSNGTQAGQVDMINGRAYNINQDMQSTVATATKTVLFGQMSQYKVRQVNSMKMQRLTELYALEDEDAFIVYTYADGGILNAGDDPIKHLLQA
jgi:HK97 family phage major capsid protein